MCAVGISCLMAVTVLLLLGVVVIIGVPGRWGGDFICSETATSSLIASSTAFGRRLFFTMALRWSAIRCWEMATSGYWMANRRCKWSR